MSLLKDSSKHATLCSLALSIFMVNCTPSHSAHSQPEQPNLKETIEWINQTYNPPSESSSKRGVFVLRDRNHVDMRLERTFLRLDGCAATIEARQDPNLEMSSESVTSTTWTFNLGDIDPAIEVEKEASFDFTEPCDTEPKSPNVCDETTFILNTRNQKQAIKMHEVTEYLKRANDRQETTDRMIDWAILYVNDLEYAPRLAAALKRGIELCGGRPSSF
jgi:hypothetical protein